MNVIPMLNVIIRAVVSPAKALMPAIRPLLSAALQEILHTVSKVFPHAEQGLKRKRTQGMVRFQKTNLFPQSVFRTVCLCLQISLARLRMNSCLVTMRSDPVDSPLKRRLSQGKFSALKGLINTSKCDLINS